MMNDATLLLDPAKIQLDPDNPPSRTKNTVDLQMAMLAAGRQIHRVVVIEPEEGKFQVISGNRRVVACRALGSLNSLMQSVSKQQPSVYVDIAANS